MFSQYCCYRSHVSETVDGLTTIRSFGLQVRLDWHMHCPHPVLLAVLLCLRLRQAQELQRFVSLKDRNNVVAYARCVAALY